ncbi:hypothetical protein KQ693_05795 [Thermus sp. PS18]|uniref:hypothetical protein n=1 Tax=Thermus sp. PS18 TaxID=2849039 RepID=UPI0022652F3E|nr:hypothetical protein [Thermus sp. PS18]UZX16541.1 hypothetical protein KQ693_05795 [Thermus sp. PS18]
MKRLYEAHCPAEGCERTIAVSEDLPGGYIAYCPCRAVKVRLGWSATATYDRVAYLVLVSEGKRKRRRK